MLQEVQECSGKVYACVSIPAILAESLDVAWNALRLELFKTFQYAIGGPKSNDDLWNTEQEGLNPEFEKLSFKLEHVCVGPWSFACL